MGLGILEPGTKVVQGTVQLFDDNDAPDQGHTLLYLKHSKNGETVLVPQPSNFQSDPLNWSIYRRDFVFGLLVVTTILSGIHGPILSPVAIQLAEEFNTSINAIAQLSSYQVLGVGIFAYVDSVIVRIFGKRGIIVCGCALLLAADGWAAGAQSYSSLMGARVVSGIAQASFEALSLSSIPDLFFVHERGKRIAIFISALQTGVYLGVPIATQVIQHSGLKWVFGSLAIAEGIMLILIFFFFHETAFKRGHIDVLANQDEDLILAQIQDTKAVSQTISNATTDSTDDEIGFWNNINIYHGRFTNLNPLSLLWRTCALTFHPTILWTGLTGLPLGWLVGVSYTISLALSRPPYNFSGAAIGNMYIAAWIGVICGYVMSLPNDWIVKRITRLNKNIYEPEFRLVMMIPATIVTVIGFTGWGWGISAETSWVGLAFFFGLCCAGGVWMNSALISYVIDAHRQFAIESQIILFALKNLIPFGMGYYFVDWYTKDGAKDVWAVHAGIIAGLALIGIGFYIFGKRLRAFWMKHPFLGIDDMRG